MLLSKVTTLDIVEVFKKYNIPLIPSGDRYVTNCVFHAGDDTPSLTIYPETNSFYCFSCKKSGDAITLISHMEGIPIYEVKRRLGTDFIKYSLSSIHKKPVDFYKTLLKDSAEIFYNYQKAFPERQSYVLDCMQQFDEFIEGCTIERKVISFDDYNKILDKLKNMLYNSFIETSQKGE